MNVDRHSALLLSTDWNAEWMQLQEARRRADDPAWWDKRAKHFRPKETSPYARDFLALAGIGPGERVLDMGCGSGTLAIPLAQRGCRVVAADFSARMLDELTTTAGEANVRVSSDDAAGIRPVLLAWDDDWASAGLDENSVDVALASRSIATHNLRAALEKLDRVATRRCCVTLACNAGPRYDAEVMNAIGVSVGESVDWLYAFNILAQMDRAPEVSYLASPRKDTFDSLEEGVADFARMLESGYEEKIDELRSYLAEHMVKNDEAGQPGPKGRLQGRYTLDHMRLTRWAFISWEPARRSAGI